MDKCPKCKSKETFKWEEDYSDKNGNPHRRAWLTCEQCRHNIKMLPLGSIGRDKEIELAINTKMPFGKFKGKPLTEIRKDYLEWIIDKSDVANKKSWVWLYNRILLILEEED